MQPVVCVQATHAPELMSHTWLVLVAQSAFVAQLRHWWLVASHTGVSPAHSLFVVQPAMQVPVAWSQVEGDGQSLAWHARHELVSASQMGVEPPQLAPVIQPTHVAVAVAQYGVGAKHADWLVAEHCPHAPLDWHAPPLALPLQSVSVAHAWHEPALHTGRSGLVQLPLVVQPAVAGPDTSQSIRVLSKSPCT